METKDSPMWLAIAEDKIVEADYDTKVTVSMFDRSAYSVIEIIDLGLTLKQRREVRMEALSLLGKKYDYTQILWYGLQKIFKLKGDNKFNNPNNLICSELVFIVLDKIGALDDLGIYGSFRGVDLTPNQLYDLIMYVSESKAL